jgi:hypothetical protein
MALNSRMPERERSSSALRPADALRRDLMAAEEALAVRGKRSGKPLIPWKRQ